MIALDAAELNQQVDEGLFIIEICQRESTHMRDQVVPINYPIHPPIVNRKGVKFYLKLVRNILKQTNIMSKHD